MMRQAQPWWGAVLVMSWLLSFGGGTAGADTDIISIFGVADALYRIDVDSGKVYRVSSVWPSDVGNSLAWDTDQNRLLYGFEGATSLSLYTSNFTNGFAAVGATSTVVSNLETLFGSNWPTNMQMTGGATYSGGNYYFIPDRAVSGSGTDSIPKVLVVNFNSNGTVASTSTIAFTTPNNDAGNFGDMAIQPSTGLLFGSSTNSNGNGLRGLWTLNLANPGAGVTMLNSNAPVYQLAFDSIGRLWAVNFNYSNLLYRLNPSNGLVLATVTLTGDLPAGFRNLAGVGVIPEPSTFLLVAGALAILGSRRGWSRRNR